MSSSEEPKPQEIVAKFQSMRMEIQNLAMKIGSLEREKEEHRTVIDALAKLNDDRKCFHLINDVLVERTVKEVKPDLELKDKNMSEMMVKLVESVKRREKELVEFQVKYKSMFTPSNAQQQQVK